MKLKLSCLILFSIIFNIFSANATIRFVSKTGSSIPPYTSWETASDSIQKCINICSFGDTVYVGNGVYLERVIMIPGLALIGAGMDSSVIYAKNLNSSSLYIQDNCLIEGFKITADVYKWALYDSGSNGSTVRFNHFENAEKYGGGVDVLNLDTSKASDLFIYKNLFSNLTIGVSLFNSNAILRKSNIYLYYNSESTSFDGVIIGAYFLNFSPWVDSNYIEVPLVGRGIYKSFGARPVISNNIIKLIQGNEGIFIGYTDSAKVYNNFIIGSPGNKGIVDGFGQDVYNNAAVSLDIGFRISGKVKNNLAINSGTGIEGSGTPVIQYNNSWNNETNYTILNPDSTNISVDPMVVNKDITSGNLDFHLQKYSPLIDSGDPALLDKNGSRSDIGLYGGPLGENYEYPDLAPMPPINLTAVVDSNTITISWNKNTETDTSFYKIYRDTVINFQIDSTKLISSAADTFFTQINPHYISKYIYKVTCIDKQGNESEPSEEVVVHITGIKDYPQIITDYQLYQNYPNPFNPATTISYRLKEKGYVKLNIYDIKGELVTTLVNENQESGFHQVDFSTNRYYGQSTDNLSSGVYIYQLMIKNDQYQPVFTDIKKMVYLK